MAAGCGCYFCCRYLAVYIARHSAAADELLLCPSPPPTWRCLQKFTCVCPEEVPIVSAAPVATPTPTPVPAAAVAKAKAGAAAGTGTAGK